MEKLNLSRRRYVIVTSDYKQIFCNGITTRFTFGEIDADRDVLNIKTFKYYEDALKIGLACILNVTEADFEEGGKYKILPVMETITQIVKEEDNEDNE